MPAAPAPFKLLHCVFLQGNSCSHRVTFSLFFGGERKNNGVCCCCPRATLPMEGSTVGRGCHCPLRLPKRFLAQDGGEAKAVPGPPASTASVVLKALDIIPCYPKSGPGEDLWMFCTTVEKRRKMSKLVGKMLVHSDSGKRWGPSPSTLSYRRCRAVVSVGTGLFPGEAMLRQPVPWQRAGCC